MTAITADAAANHDFYTRLLGLRLVKKTVNQDDVSAYHLYYGDGRASPGSALTFFDWPLPRERRGTRSVIRTGLRVAAGEEALVWWEERFRAAGVLHSPRCRRDGRLTVDFEDPEGQRLSLVEDENDDRGTGVIWEKSPIPAPMQIRGLGAITISVPDGEALDRFLTDVLSMYRSREYEFHDDGARRIVYQMEGGGPARELHVALEPSARTARQGAGGVHHLAFRAPGMDEYEDWISRLQDKGVPSSGPVDRHYFKSLYFHEPNGILIEIATDEPGFTVDEPMEALGEQLALPPFLEERRQAIEEGLKPLR